MKIPKRKTLKTNQLNQWQINGDLYQKSLMKKTTGYEKTKTKRNYFPMVIWLDQFVR